MWFFVNGDSVAITVIYKVNDKEREEVYEIMIDILLNERAIAIYEGIYNTPY